MPAERIHFSPSDTEPFRQKVLLAHSLILAGFPGAVLQTQKLARQHMGYFRLEYACGIYTIVFEKERAFFDLAVYDGTGASSRLEQMLPNFKAYADEDCMRLAVQTVAQRFRQGRIDFWQYENRELIRRSDGLRITFPYVFPEDT